MTCAYCGMTHTTKCHLVKAIEHYPDGTVKRVEFYSPKDYAPITVATVPQVSSAGGHATSQFGGEVSNPFDFSAARSCSLAPFQR